MSESVEIDQAVYDKLIAEGMPEEFVAIANDKLAAINAAWDRVSAQRGLN